jgi:hypothetical protein
MRPETALESEVIQAYFEDRSDPCYGAPSWVFSRPGLDPTQRLRRDPEPFREGRLADAGLFPASTQNWANRLLHLNDAPRRLSDRL